jgi:hypothetical protein
MQWLLLSVALLAADLPLAKESDALKRAIVARDVVATAAAARDIERAAALLAPLEVFDGQALATPPEGLGIYDPLPNGVVRSEELFFYAQVRNHTVRTLPGGWHELHLVTDLVVIDAEGAEVARDMAFGESRFTARAVHRDTFVVIALRVKGLPAGRYRVRLVVHDQVSARKGEVEIPFTQP